MENGEWRMENGERRMENGERRMENGEWRRMKNCQVRTGDELATKCFLQPCEYLAFFLNELSKNRRIYLMTCHWITDYTAKNWPSQFDQCSHVLLHTHLPHRTTIVFPDYQEHTHALWTTRVLNMNLSWLGGAS